MKPVWKISGDFYGWISDNGSFYNSNGKRQGTFQNDILYNHRGKYCGELINADFIGCNEDRDFLEGPECYLDGEIYMEPLLPKEPFDAIGYVNPL